MNSISSTPPTLCSISQCKTDLNFEPVSHWPDGLPAVAVNGWVLAGFSQGLVFNHIIDINSPEKIHQLFHSLYTELSFVELVRLWNVSKKMSWFPFALLADKYHLRINEQFEQMADIVLQQPAGFLQWCAEKKVGLGDLLPLLSAQSLNLKPVFHRILQLKLSKADAISALEMCVDLLLMGRTEQELQIDNNIQSSDATAATWLRHIKNLRFPNTRQKDATAEKNISSLPWPGSSQVRWARQGDKAGIEVKLFVTRPDDLKKYANSFEKIQELLEGTKGDLWKEH